LEPRKPANPPDTRTTTGEVVVVVEELDEIEVVVEELDEIEVGGKVVVVLIGITVVVVNVDVAIVVVDEIVVLVEDLSFETIGKALGGSATNHFTVVSYHKHLPVRDQRNKPEFLSAHVTTLRESEILLSSVPLSGHLPT